MLKKRLSSLTVADVAEFYSSDIVIDTFNYGFSGRWHTIVRPALPNIYDTIDLVNHFLQVRPNHHVLDFGSGSGITTCDVAKRTGCFIRGLNISRKQVEIANLYRSQTKFAHRVAFDIYEGDRFPYGDNTFDRVTFFESPCHVPDKTWLYQEIYRVLKIGGMCGGQDWMLERDDLSEEEYITYIQPIEQSISVELCSLQSYKELLKKAGFSSIRTVNARQIDPDLSNSFTIPPDSPIYVSQEDPLPIRLSQGSRAMSIAFQKRLFTIGFVWGEKIWKYSPKT